MSRLRQIHIQAGLEGSSHDVSEENKSSVPLYTDEEFKKYYGKDEKTIDQELSDNIYVDEDTIEQLEEKCKVIESVEEKMKQALTKMKQENDDSSAIQQMESLVKQIMDEAAAFV